MRLDGLDTMLAWAMGAHTGTCVEKQDSYPLQLSLIAGYD